MYNLSCLLTAILLLMGMTFGNCTSDPKSSKSSGTVPQGASSSDPSKSSGAVPPGIGSSGSSKSGSAVPQGTSSSGSSKSGSAVPQGASSSGSSKSGNAVPQGAESSASSKLEKTPSRPPDVLPKPVTETMTSFLKSLEGLDSNIQRVVQTIDGNLNLCNVGCTSEQLGNKKVIIVNAANENLQPGHGGLNAGITRFVRDKEGVTDNTWTNLVSSAGSDSSASPEIPLSSGAFAVSDFNQGKIYHAVGPRAINVGQSGHPENLEQVKDILAGLYRAMLKKAEEDGAEVIILSIVSGNIFAGDGKDKDGNKFTKNQFLQNVYKGIIQGIELGKSSNVKIIFNTK